MKNLHSIEIPTRENGTFKYGKYISPLTDITINFETAKFDIEEFNKVVETLKKRIQTTTITMNMVYKDLFTID